MNFSTIPVKKPINAPEACFKAGSICAPETKPPNNAPTNGPRIMPNGPNQNPANNPILEPQTTYLLPPNFFVLQTGKILSRTAIISVNNPTTITTVHERRSLIEGANFKTNKPTHDNGGPGNIGSTEPITPIMRRIIAKAIKIGSNMSLLMLSQHPVRHSSMSHNFKGTRIIRIIQPVLRNLSSTMIMCSFIYTQHIFNRRKYSSNVMRN